MRILANGNVGIGLTEPTQLLHIENNAAAPRIRISTTGSFNATFTANSNRDNENQGLFLFVTEWNSTIVGRVGFTAGPDTVNKDDSKFIIQTAMGGSISTKLTLDENGNVGIGSNVSPSAGGGTVLFFADNATDPTMGANTAGFYGKDVAGTVEAFAVDEAGNAAQLTPHNFTLFTPNPSFEYPWSYYSKNRYIGKEINADIFGAIREIEQLTGKTFIHLQDLPVEEHLNWDTVQAQEVQRSITRREQQQLEQLDDPDVVVEDLYVAKLIPSWMENL